MREIANYSIGDSCFEKFPSLERIKNDKFDEFPKEFETELKNIINFLGCKEDEIIPVNLKSINDNNLRTELITRILLPHKVVDIHNMLPDSNNSDYIEFCYNPDGYAYVYHFNKNTKKVLFYITRSMIKAYKCFKRRLVVLKINDKIND